METRTLQADIVGSFHLIGKLVKHLGLPEQRSDYAILPPVPAIFIEQSMMAAYFEAGGEMDELLAAIRADCAELSFVRDCVSEVDVQLENDKTFRLNYWYDESGIVVYGINTCTEQIETA